VIDTVAAWTRRGFPVIFAGNAELAGRFALHYLAQQMNEAQRLVAAVQAASKGLLEATTA